MQWYQKTIEEVLRDLDSSKKGLSGEKAESRLGEFGLNKVTEGKPVSKLKLLLGQFKNPRVYTENLGDCGEGICIVGGRVYLNIPGFENYVCITTNTTTSTTSSTTTTTVLEFDNPGLYAVNNTSTTLPPIIYEKQSSLSLEGEVFMNLSRQQPEIYDILNRRYLSWDGIDGLCIDYDEGFDNENLSQSPMMFLDPYSHPHIIWDNCSMNPCYLRELNCDGNFYNAINDYMGLEFWMSERVDCCAMGLACYGGACRTPTAEHNRSLPLGVPECIDTDGEDPFTRGTSKLVYSNGVQRSVDEDYCGMGDVLIEGYCTLFRNITPSVQHLTYACPELGFEYQCTNGRCERDFIHNMSWEYQMLFNWSQQTYDNNRYVEDACFDMTDGFDPFNRNAVVVVNPSQNIFSEGHYTIDRCSDDNNMTLIENYCINNNKDYKTQNQFEMYVNCGRYGMLCWEGRCVPPDEYGRQQEPQILRFEEFENN